MKIPKKWVFAPPVKVPASLKAGFTGSEFILKFMVRRGILTPQAASAFLDFRCFSPQSPYDLPGMTCAVERIQSAINQHQTIGIWGDFDVDGQTATALLVQTMRWLGASCVYHVPVRSHESHGVQSATLKQFLTPSMKFIITCDTGISATDSAAYLKSIGVDLIITDHHSLPAELPEALAVINPHFLPPEHPFSTLAGAGVAYLLAEALLSANSMSTLGPALHDLVALGCIADLALLQAETRYLVQSGLDHINSHPRLFMVKMAELLDLPLGQIDEEHVGFTIAPRLNAVGRLDDANPLVEWMLSEDEEFVLKVLNRMEALNANRRVLVNQVFEGCLTQLDASPLLFDQPALILSHPEWPAGVIGIAASRLAQVAGRPVFLLAGGAAGTLHGSARSVEGIDITVALAQNEALLTTFGGHPMAAGFSIQAENLPEFRARMQLTIAEMIAIRHVEPELQIESSLPLNEVNFDLLKDLERLAPFGPGNPAPVFSAPDLTLESVNPLGRSGDHLQVTVKDENDLTHKLVWWQGAGLPLPEGKFDIAYALHLNNYRGTPQIQMEWIDFRPAVQTSTPDTRKQKRRIVLNDFRDQAFETSQDLLEGLHREGALIWSEGSHQVHPAAIDRFQLTQSRSLVVGTVPPSSDVLLDAISHVKPVEIHFFGFTPPEDALGVFLRTMGSYLKQLIKSDSHTIQISQCAALFATTETMAKTALQWYAARGLIGLAEVTRDQYALLSPVPSQTDLAGVLENRLKSLSTEISAFRRFYLSASLSSLTNQNGH